MAWPTRGADPDLKNSKSGGSGSQPERVSGVQGLWKEGLWGRRDKDWGPLDGDRLRKILTPGSPGVGGLRQGNWVAVSTRGVPHARTHLLHKVNPSPSGGDWAGRASCFHSEGNWVAGGATV